MVKSLSGATRTPSVEEIAQKTESFRAWLRNLIERDRRSLHAIEVEAGIPGNALGKFLRGERGARHSLTPRLIQRLAPVIRVGEVELLVRAGHLSYEPQQESAEMAILASRALDDEAKLILLALYARIVGLPPLVVEL